MTVMVDLVQKSATLARFVSAVRMLVELLSRGDFPVQLAVFPGPCSVMFWLGGTIGVLG